MMFFIALINAVIASVMIGVQTNEVYGSALFASLLSILAMMEARK
jgi:hypothetical protein